MRTDYLQLVSTCMHHAVRDEMAHHRYAVPVPVESMIRAAGWKIVPVAVSTAPRFEAATLFPARIIVVNPHLSACAQRFALAHEWMHVQYHGRHVSPNLPYHVHPYHDELEVEANAGAAELLLPYEWFMDTAQALLHQPLPTAEALQAFMATPEAARWAHQAQVTRSVLRYHLVDCGWVASASG